MRHRLRLRLPRPSFAGFLAQSLRHFKQTGSVCPSSRVLGRVMTRQLSDRRPLRVLEVGAGSGAFSEHIIRATHAESSIDLVEINRDLASLLEERLAGLNCNGRQVRVHCRDIRDFEPEAPYDAVICGLPFSNFGPDQVEELLQLMLRTLRPGGELCFFEYTMLRPVMMRRPGAHGARLRAVQAVIHRFGQRYRMHREVVLRNLPPATVIRFRTMGPQLTEP
jgi:phospholipid N-methyltransferase